jgi:hypothetical protein
MIGSPSRMADEKPPAEGCLVVSGSPQALRKVTVIHRQTAPFQGTNSVCNNPPGLDVSKPVV